MFENFSFNIKQQQATATSPESGRPTKRDSWAHSIQPLVRESEGSSRFSSPRVSLTNGEVRQSSFQFTMHDLPILHAPCPTDDMILILGTDGMMMVVSPTGVKAERKFSACSRASVVSWHPNGAFFAVAAGGNAYFFDVSLSSLFVCLKGETTPRNHIELSKMGIKSTIKVTFLNLTYVVLFVFLLNDFCITDAAVGHVQLVRR